MEDKIVFSVPWFDILERPMVLGGIWGRLLACVAKTNRQVDTILFTPQQTAKSWPTQGKVLTLPRTALTAPNAFARWTAT